MNEYRRTADRAGPSRPSVISFEVQTPLLAVVRTQSYTEARKDLFVVCAQVPVDCYWHACGSAPAKYIIPSISYYPMLSSSTKSLLPVLILSV